MNPVTINDTAAWNKVWDTVHALFSTFAVDLFWSTYLGYFIILVILVGLALFLWRWYNSV
jgi:hypothetical protein